MSSSQLKPPGTGRARLAAREPREAQRFLRFVMDAALDPLFGLGLDGRITDVNAATVRATGVSRERLVGTEFTAYFSEPERAREGYELARAQGHAGDLPLTLQHVSGRLTEVLCEANAYRDAQDRVVGVFVATRDVTSARRAERHIAMLAEANQALMRARDEGTLLREITDIVTAAGGYRLSWIGLAVPEGRAVTPVAQSGFERGYLAQAAITWDDTPRGGGPTGRAVRLRTVQVCRDILHDPAMAPWREAALARGYQSSAVMPFVVDDDVFVLHAYAGQPDAFDDAELSTLRQLAGNLAVGVGALRSKLERERAQEALRAAVAYNRSLIEASLDPLVTIDRDGRITDVNQATLQATGGTREEMVGTEFSGYFTDPVRARNAYRRAFLQGTVRDYLLELRHCDGHTTPVVYNASVYHDEKGEVAGVFAAARDVTTLRRSQEALRRSEALLNETQRVTRVGGWEYDVDMAALTWTDEVYRIHGLSPLTYNPSEPRQEFAFYVPGDRERIEEAFDRVVQLGEPYDLQLQLVTAEGDRLWVRTIGQAERHGGRVTRIFGNIMDISDRKRAELELTAAHEELRRLNAELEDRVRRRHGELLTRTAELTTANEQLRVANRELESFSYTVSHDLRAPVRAVCGFAEILLDDYGSLLDDEGRRLIGIVVNSAQRMGHLIDDLLAFSRIGRREMATELVDMTALARSVAEELRAQASGRDIDVDIADLEPAAGDSALLTQVWTNLLTNAVKFTGLRQHARIQVTSDRENTHVVYRVTDNGVGFDMAHASRLFEVFRRLHAQDEYPGTGVGLAIVARIIARHGGRVWAYAEPDRGATFSFTLPALEGTSR